MARGVAVSPSARKKRQINPSVQRLNNLVSIMIYAKAAEFWICLKFILGLDPNFAKSLILKSICFWISETLMWLSSTTVPPKTTDRVEIICSQGWSMPSLYNLRFYPRIITMKQIKTKTKNSGSIDISKKGLPLFSSRLLQPLADSLKWGSDLQAAFL